MASKNFLTASSQDSVLILGNNLSWESVYSIFSKCGSVETILALFSSYIFFKFIYVSTSSDKKYSPFLNLYFLNGNSGIRILTPCIFGVYKFHKGIDSSESSVQQLT